MARVDGPNYGSRTQVHALVEQLDDVQGNRDGIAGNEGQKAGTPAKDSFFHTQPVLNAIRNHLANGLSDKDEKARLTQFVATQEKAWGQPVSQLPKGRIPDDGDFRAEKAIALARYGRTPADVTEGFVHAGGTVDGQTIASRDVFWQRWKPIGEPNGKVAVVSPGFQETGRNFFEQVHQLNQQGYDVVVMDHQWAGYSQGDKGTLDRGFGVARDVAAVSAYASQVAKDSYGDPNAVVLVGNSMGAGPGVLGALTLNDNGKIQLDGPQMPKGLSAVLQAPYLEPSPSLMNKLLAVSAKIPGLKDVAMPSSGLPVLTHNAAAQAKLANHVAAEHIVARPEALTAAKGDLEVVKKLIAEGHGPTGRVAIIHGNQDPLASPAASKKLASQLGANARLDLIESNNHVLEESPTEQGHLLDAMKWLGAAR